MAETMHLIARTLHITFAMLWVGYLGTVAWILLPGTRGGGGHAPNIGPLVKRMRLGLFLGPLTLLMGAWLVTAAGYSWGGLADSNAGLAIIGGIVVAVVMMGIEGGILMPAIRDAHQATGGDRHRLLSRAQATAHVNAALGLLAVFMMVSAGLGGF